MKQLSLQTAHYQYLEKHFSEWLDILGYSASAVYILPTHLREFFYYLEQHGILHINQITTHDIHAYYRYLSQRPNQVHGGGLSNNSLNKHQNALRKFGEYLFQMGRMEMPFEDLVKEQTLERSIMPFSVREIKQLYEAAQPQNSAYQQDCFAMRDKAMLSVFYGCGLRRNEGYHLDVSDINFDQKRVHVRKGKNYKERFVPFSKTTSKHLQTYLYDARPYLLKTTKTEAFFLSQRGKRMEAQSMALRLRVLGGRVPNIGEENDKLTLHNLRHSIATHFLQGGMSLEQISLFLGHSSLESTQVYTHLIHPEA